MREDVFRVLKIFGEEKSKSKSQCWLLPNFDFWWNHRIKRWDNITKVIFLETRENEENFDIKIVIFRAQLDFCDFSKWMDENDL